MEIDRDIAAVSWVKPGFYAIAILFNVCLIAQVLTVGVAYFTDPAWWNIHVWLVRGYSGLSLILLAGSLIVPFSNIIRSLAASLPVLLGLQFCSIHLKTPLHLDVLHPLIGFTLFYVSSSLVHRVAREVFNKSDAVTESKDLKWVLYSLVFCLMTFCNANVTRRSTIVMANNAIVTANSVIVTYHIGIVLAYNSIVTLHNAIVTANNGIATDHNHIADYSIGITGKGIRTQR